MDTHNPYFTRAEVAYRHEQARQGFRWSRRKRDKGHHRPIGRPLTDDGL